MPWNAHGGQKPTCRSWFSCSVGPRDEIKVTGPDKGKCHYLWSHLSDRGIFTLFTFVVYFWPRTDLNWSSCVYLPNAGITSICCLSSPVTSLRSNSNDSGKVCYVIKFLTEHRVQFHVHFSGNRMNNAVMINILLDCFFFFLVNNTKQKQEKRLFCFGLCFRWNLAM